MVLIENIKARQIFDSRGNPTVEVDIFIEEGIWARGITPSGASVGKYEAIEIRDNQAIFEGKGVYSVVANIIDHIAPVLIGKRFKTFKEVDNILLEIDGTTNKRKLGSNAILPVSLAFAKVLAAGLKIPLYQLIARYNNLHSHFQIGIPTPMLNVINGGCHADNQLAIQEFMLVPSTSVELIDQLEISYRVLSNLRRVLQKRGLSTSVGDEGGFAPLINNTREVLDILNEAIFASDASDSIKIALDIAASEFYEDGIYYIDKQKFNSTQLLEYYTKLLSEYKNIISLEDPFADDDLDGWRQGSQELSGHTMVVGDDFFVTCIQRLNIGIREKIGNAIIIKPNQVGTLSEALDAIILAKKNDYTPIISHRSGETEDVSIAHIAVGTGASYLKSGSLCRTERTAKYNELLRISEEI